MAFWTGGGGPVGAWWTGAAAACAGTDIATGSRRLPAPYAMDPRGIWRCLFVSFCERSGSCDWEQEVTVVYADLVFCLSTFWITELGQPDDPRLYFPDAL